MKIEFTAKDNYFLFHAGKHEDDLKEFLSYNDEIFALEKRLGREIDLDDKEDLEELGRNAGSPHVQNWASYQLTGERINLYIRGGEDPTFKHWEMSDGWKTIVQKVTDGRLKIRTGLIGKVVKYLQERNCEISVLDQRSQLPNLTKEPVYQFAEITLRDDQRDVIDKFREHLSSGENINRLFANILLDLAVNTGKTYLAAAIIYNLQKPKVIMFHREVYLCGRAVADYMKLGFKVGCIAADKKAVRAELKLAGIKEDPIWGHSDFTIAMVQTLSSRLKSGKFSVEDLRNYNVGLFDECEQFCGDQTTMLVDKMRMPMKIGYSGTPFSSESGYNRFTVLGLFGSQVYKITTADNVEKGVSLKPIVNFNLNSFRGGAGKTKSAIKTFLYSDRHRLKIAADRIKHHSDNGRKGVMFYYGDADLIFGDWLMKELQELFPRLNIEHINGKVKGRSEIFENFREGQADILVCNDVVKRGANLKNLSIFINWESTMNDISMVQAAIGRGTRTDGKNEDFYVEAFYDLGNPHSEDNSMYQIRLFSKAEHGAEINFLYKNSDGGIPL